MILPHVKPWAKRASLTPRKTYSAESKVIYKRKPHLFSLKDIERISRKFQKEDDVTTEETLPLYLEVLNRIAYAMLDRIFGLLGIEKGVGRILWDWFQSLWERMIYRVTGFQADQVYARIYMEKYKHALQEYLDGNPDILYKLIEDITGG